MEYTKIKEVAKALCAKLESIELGEAKLFRHVRRAAVTGDATALKAVNSITQCPAAIVCLGLADPQDAMTHRDLVFRVIAVFPFAAGSDKAADDAWDALDFLDRAFAPDESEAPCILAGQPCFAGEAEPLQLDTAHSAYVFTVNVF